MSGRTRLFRNNKTIPCIMQNFVKCYCRCVECFGSPCGISPWRIIIECKKWLDRSRFFCWTPIFSQTSHCDDCRMMAISLSCMRERRRSPSSILFQISPSSNSRYTTMCQDCKRGVAICHVSDYTRPQSHDNLHPLTRLFRSLAVVAIIVIDDSYLNRFGNHRRKIKATCPVYKSRLYLPSAWASVMTPLYQSGPTQA